MEEGDNSAPEEWYTYQLGDRSFNKLGDAASHPEAVKIATHLRVEASRVACNSFFRFHALFAVDLLPGLQEIGDRAFQYCSNLQFISISSSVRVIGERAFQACSSLRTVTIPKSTSIIRSAAFGDCSALTTVNLPKDGTLEVLADFLFSNCSALKVIHVPSSVKHIRKCVFSNCEELETIELPVGILSIGKRCFFDACSLVNIIIPSTVDCIEDELFVYAHEIRAAFPHISNDDDAGRLAEDEDYEEDYDETNTDFVNAMMTRFDDLPLHTMCYYHTYYPIEKTINDIRNEVQDCDRVDVFKFTPVHVLALSSEPNVQLFKELARCSAPSMFTAMDKWGMRPIEYLFKSRMPGAKASADFLIQYTVVDRSQWLGLDRWRTDIANLVDLLDLSDHSTQDGPTLRLYGLLEKLELVESTSLVETALWKLHIDRTKSSSTPNNVDRSACRINCGAEIIIRNVLQFLLDDG
ncbi:unnamed protein product [Cylindrotheca closterium]|uniref:Uncharacterized protein n=1 Tax=Cylindrotheca closterium TaxID=2856 RepID=A0AAD2G4R1_9STRA|nr:unnamed protein product [Cylindrotheca closterium]